MTHEEFETHTFRPEEEVLHQGKPVHVISSNGKSLCLRISKGHIKTVLPVEVELIDRGSDVETR